MKLLSEMAVFLALFGSLIMIVGAITYFGTQGQNQQRINSKFGIFAHREFLLGLFLYILSWLVKLIVYWIDPSIPMFGPGFMWYRMSGGSDNYDNPFMN